MVQSEKGLESFCICPICFSKCSACVDNKTSPLNVQALRDLYLKVKDDERDER